MSTRRAIGRRRPRYRDEEDHLAWDSRRTEGQRAQWGADVREGVPTPNIVPGDDIPEGLKRERKG